MPGFFQIKSYLTYWLDAVNEHSLHSPFLFDLYTKVILGSPEGIPEIEALREKLLNDEREIGVEDFGVGSKHLKTFNRKVSAIAQTSLSDTRFSSLYLRLAHFVKAKNIIELGTSFGINTLYLAHKKDARVFTFEGSKQVAEIAEISFEFGGAQNIELIQGSLDTTLYSNLSRMPRADLIFMDANHQYEPTKRYFNWLLMKTHHGSVVILDDIHDNPGMEKAWREISHHELVYVSIDLFRCGILFFDPSLTKRHVVLQF